MPNVKVRITSESEEQQRGAAEQLVSSSGNFDRTKMATTSLFVSAAARNIKTAVAYGLQNYGNFTGDYIGQESINQALEVVGNVSSIALGAVSGGWVGAVIATASVAVSAATKEFSKQMQYKADEINAEYARQRSGNALYDGSRGTEN